MQRYARRGHWFVATALVVACSFAFAADGDTATAWDALGTAPQPDACPELFAKFFPAGVTYECAPSDRGATANRKTLDAWFDARFGDAASGDAWVKWKVGQVRTEPFDSLEWVAWWVPKNEQVVVRAVRSIDVSACTATIDGATVETAPPGAAKMQGTWQPNYPERARIERRSGFTVHVVQLDEAGAVTNVCPAYQKQQLLPLLIHDRRTCRTFTNGKTLFQGRGCSKR